MDWFNSNSGAITGMAAMITALFGVIAAGATAVLAIITRRYVHLTKNYVRLTNDILDEHRQMRIDAQKPEITIRLVSVIGQRGSISAHLCVENIGSGLARDIEFPSVPPISIYYGPKLPYWHFIRFGISILPPGEKKTVELGERSRLNLEEQQYEITVAYKDSGNREYEDTFPLDFRQLWRV